MTDIRRTPHNITLHYHGVVRADCGSYVDPVIMLDRVRLGDRDIWEVAVSDYLQASLSNDHHSFWRNNPGLREWIINRMRAEMLTVVI